MATKEPTSARLIISLALTGLFSAVVLSGIYSTTLPMIRRNQAEALQKAIFRVLPATASYRAFQVEDGVMVPFQSAAGELPEGEALYMGIAEDGRLTGFAVPAEGAGFMDTIKILYGFKPAEEMIVGIAVLESRETPGLGDKIEKDADFLNSFLDLKVTPEIVAVKKGPRVEPNQVDAISGATISSEAVIKILNSSISRLPEKFPNAKEE